MSLFKAVKYNVHKNDKSHVLDRHYDIHEEFEKNLISHKWTYIVTAFLLSFGLALAMTI